MAGAKVISDFEVLTIDDAGRRRAWSHEDKARIVEESLRGYRQGSATARRHGISRSLLTRWRAEFNACHLAVGRPTFSPLTLANDMERPLACEPSPMMPAVSANEVTIEIVLRNGCGFRSEGAHHSGE